MEYGERNTEERTAVKPNSGSRNQERRKDSLERKRVQRGAKSKMQEQ